MYCKSSSIALIWLRDEVVTHAKHINHFHCILLTSILSLNLTIGITSLNVMLAIAMLPVANNAAVGQPFTALLFDHKYSIVQSFPITVHIRELNQATYKSKDPIT